MKSWRNCRNKWKTSREAGFFVENKYDKIEKNIGAIDMKQLSKIIILLLAGLLIMIGLIACGEKIPENRTKEQYELEKEFQPLFDFLAEEKKDLSNVKIYYSSIYITDRKTKTTESRSIRFENLGTEISGEYKIEDGKNVKRIPVTFQSDKISYKNNVEESEKYNIDIFNLQLTPKFFQVFRYLIICLIILKLT